MSTSKGISTGRPRLDLDGAAFAATLRIVHEHGYAGATCERVASAIGVAKTTIYRRWPDKGSLIIDVLLDAFGPLPLSGDTRGEIIESGIRWIAEKIGEPGVGAAFAGVFSEAVSDSTLREALTFRLQEPYRRALQEALDEPEQRMSFLIDVVTGPLLHRLGISGEPMAEADVGALVAMVVPRFDDGRGTAMRTSAPQES